jgi:hypothetical protein
MMTVEVEVVQIRPIRDRVIVLVEYTVTFFGVVVVTLRYVLHGIVIVLTGKVVESVSVRLVVTASGKY